MFGPSDLVFSPFPLGSPVSFPDSLPLGGPSVLLLPGALAWAPPHITGSRTPHPPPLFPIQTFLVEATLTCAGVCLPNVGKSFRTEQVQS